MPWPHSPASGRPKAEGVPWLATTRQRRETQLLRRETLKRQLCAGQSCNAAASAAKATCRLAIAVDPQPLLQAEHGAALAAEPCRPSAQ